MEQAICHRKFNGDVADGWKSDADGNAVIKKALLCRIDDDY